MNESQSLVEREKLIKETLPSVIESYLPNIHLDLIKTGKTFFDVNERWMKDAIFNEFENFYGSKGWVVEKHYWSGIEPWISIKSQEIFEKDSRKFRNEMITVASIIASMVLFIILVPYLICSSG